MRGNGKIGEAAVLLNNIIQLINIKGRDKPNGIILLGHDYWRAYQYIEANDNAIVCSDKSLKENILPHFYGWPILFVERDNYLNLVE